jgi:tRNA threonylcarbamoyladenosine modification (KEOPS) complex Cgi121 subunit
VCFPHISSFWILAIYIESQDHLICPLILAIAMIKVERDIFRAFMGEIMGCVS